MFFLLIQADAKQLEFRCIVDLANDPTGILEIQNGLDTHSINQEAFNLPSRLIAKIYLFRTIYRGSGYAFAKDPEFSHVSTDPDFWEEINRKFYQKYNGIDRKHKEWAECVVTGRPIIGPSGRHWPISMDVDYQGNPKIPWTVLTNYPVQGTSADIMAVARVSLYNRLRQHGRPEVKIVSSVHDSIVVDAPKVDGIPELFYNVFRDLPENFRRIFNYKMNVPYACEVKVGDNLSDMESYEPV